MKDFRSYGHKLLTVLLVMSVVLNIVLLARPAPKQGQAVEEGTPDFSDPLSDIQEPEPEVVKVEETEPEPRRRHYGVTVATDWEESRGVPVPYPGGLGERAVSETIEESLREAFGRMTDHFLLENHSYIIGGSFTTDRLFRLNMAFFRVEEGKEAFRNQIILTVDRETGKILYLDDVVDMDGLSEAIRVEGILRIPEYYLDPGNRDYLPQDWLDSYHAYFMEKLYQCCEPYEDDWWKPCFYLTEDRIYFPNITNNGRYTTDLYINLEDIQDILKIDIL